MIKVIFIGLFTAIITITSHTNLHCEVVEDIFENYCISDKDELNDPEFIRHHGLEQDIFQDFYDSMGIFPDSDTEWSLRCYMTTYDSLTDGQKVYMQNKKLFHKENSQRCYRLAKNRCLSIENVEDREIAKNCIYKLMDSDCFMEYKSIFISLLKSFLKDGGLEKTREWKYISTKLTWAEYHFDELEFCEKFCPHDEIEKFLMEKL